MKRVTGIGGIHFSAKNPEALRAWYKNHLGVDVQEWGGTAFRWVDDSGDPVNGTTAWIIGDGSGFAPSKTPYMITYRVDDLHALVAALRDEGCHVLVEKNGDIQESGFGKFAWVMDPEGNKVELWEPPEGQ